jgi:riboflavin kinase/FMN adenylyltransferase
MEIINVQHPHQLLNRAPSCVALGTFDGLHLGHQKVIQRAIDIARDNSLLAGVVTFYPHPKEVLGKIEKANYLTPLDEKLGLLEKMGLDFTIVVQFTESFASLTPIQFIEQYIKALSIEKVVTGFDFCFGHRGQGTTQTLQDWSTDSRDFDLYVVPSLDDQQQKVSSSRIRKLLLDGEVEQAASLLGRNYEIKGQVIHGEKRGRLLGFPTANLELHQPHVIPRLGVYAVQLIWNNRLSYGVINIGIKPTFETNLLRPTIEVHIFDFNEEIYGHTLSVQFVSYIRSEQKFNSIDDLKAQIKLDSIQAKSRLGYIK